MHVAEQHLGLLGSAPAGPAGSWRSEGELPWALASQLAPLALQSGALTAQQAGRVALGACGAVEAALKPVLQQDDSASEPSVHGSPMHAQLPTPAFVAAAAALAAQTAGSLAEQEAAAGVLDGLGADAAEQVTDTLLEVCEDCAASVAELGVGDRASDALLNICNAVARQLLPLLTGAGERDAGALSDQLPRLQNVLVSRPAGRGGRQSCSRSWKWALCRGVGQMTCKAIPGLDTPHLFPPLAATFAPSPSRRVRLPGWLSWSTSSPAMPPPHAPARSARAQVRGGAQG